MPADLPAARARMSEPMDVSIVIPLFNAEQTIVALVGRLTEVFAPQCRAFQIVLVNDGSQDRTQELCLGLVAEHSDRLTYLQLAKNFGEHNAVMAGLQVAAGAYVVVMDDDFENRPEDALRLFQEASTGGYELVYSVYPRREHHWFRLLGSRFNGWIANLMLDKPRDLYLSSFKCLSRWLVQEVIKYRGPFPYLDGLALRCTRNIGRVQVVHQRRAAGQSGYTLRKLVRLWMSTFINFSVAPLRASFVMGMTLMACGLGLTAWVVAEKLSGSLVPSGWPFLVIITMLFSGTQLMMLGLVGEYVGRMFLSMNETPQFVVREAHGVRLQEEISRV